MDKASFLKFWNGLAPTRIMARPVPYKHRGSTFDCDGIRITGSDRFIASVLGNLKDLLRYEGAETRLQVTYQDAKDKQGRPTGSKSCYIQVHERGPEAKVLNARYGHISYNKLK